MYTLKSHTRLLFLFVFSIGFHLNAQSNTAVEKVPLEQTKTEKKKKKKKKRKGRQPKIDLSHWKVTLPVTNDQGKPYEIEPPEIFDYATNEMAKPYMYLDDRKGAIVFHAMPTASKTANTKYTHCDGG